MKRKYNSPFLIYSLRTAKLPDFQHHRARAWSCPSYTGRYATSQERWQGNMRVGRVPYPGCAELLIVILCDSGNGIKKSAFERCGSSGNGPNLNSAGAGFESWLERCLFSPKACLVVKPFFFSDFNSVFTAVQFRPVLFAFVRTMLSVYRRGDEDVRCEIRGQS
jgi:hypothetical protein